MVLIFYVTSLSRRRSRLSTCQYIYGLYAVFCILFIFNLVAIASNTDNVMVPSMYECSLATDTALIPPNQAESDLHCHDKRYKEKSYLKMAFLIVNAFIVILGIIELTYVVTLLPPQKLVEKLLGDMKASYQQLPATANKPQGET